MGTVPNGINIARTNIEFGGAGDELCCVAAIDPCAVCSRQAGKINSINRLPKRHLGILGVPKNQTACKSSSDIAGARGPWDRPVGRSVDRCILIGFLPWTVWTARGPSRGPFRGPLYFDRFCPVDRKFILENKINLIF